MAGLGHGHQAERLVEGAGAQAGFGRGQSAIRTTGWPLRERDRALQERCSCGKAAPCLGPVSGSLELRRHVLVRSERGLGSMPGTTVRIDPWIGGCGQSPVRVTPLGRRRGSIDRRAQKRVTEADTSVDVDQVLCLCSRGRAGGDARARRHGAPEQVGVTDRVGRCHEQQALRLLREDLDPSAVALLDTTGQRYLLAME